VDTVAQDEKKEQDKDNEENVRSYTNSTAVGNCLHTLCSDASVMVRSLYLKQFLLCG
jgi:hypothetical protein